MRTPRAKMNKLKDQRDQLLKEIEALRNKVAGLEMAMSLLDSNEDGVSSKKGSRRRGNVKSTILELLSEVGTTGLNANTTVEMAKRRGVDLDRASVSSLLSRLKREEVLDYDGDKYRLKEFSEPKENPNVSILRSG